jgi:undecaprenyl-diphosphatase
MSLPDLDKKLFVFFNKTHYPILDTIMFAIRNMILWVPLILVCFFIYNYYRKGKLKSNGVIKFGLIVFLILVQMLLCLFILPYVFDPILHKERPFYDSELSTLFNVGDVDFGKREVFYAPKTCAVAAISFFLIVFYHTPKWIKGALIAWVLLIIYNRIYTGAYYPSGVFVSVILGVCIGLFARRYYTYLKESVFVI